MKHFVWSIFIYYWIDGASGTRTFPVIKHCAQLLLKSYWEAKCLYIAQKEKFILEVVEKQENLCKIGRLDFTGGVTTVYALFLSCLF